MSLYSDLHTALRKRINSVTINYLGNAIDKYWALENTPENGAHVVLSTETTNPLAGNIGATTEQDICRAPAGALQISIT